MTKTSFLLAFSFMITIEITEAKAVSIEKTETSDSYYYSVKDTERDLEYSWHFIKEQGQNISVEDSLYIEEDLRLSLDAKTKDTRCV